MAIFVCLVAISLAQSLPAPALLYSRHLSRLFRQADHSRDAFYWCIGGKSAHTACTRNVSLSEDLTATSHASLSPRTMRLEEMICDSGSKLPKPPLNGTSPSSQRIALEMATVGG
jgi:hypothetical protein